MGKPNHVVAGEGPRSDMHPRIASRRDLVVRETVDQCDETMLHHLSRIADIAARQVPEPDRALVTKALAAADRSIRLTDPFTGEGRTVRQWAKKIAEDVGAVILAHAVTDARRTLAAVVDADEPDAGS